MSAPGLNFLHEALQDHPPSAIAQLRREDPKFDVVMAYLMSMRKLARGRPNDRPPMGTLVCHECGDEGTEVRALSVRDGYYYHADCWSTVSTEYNDPMSPTPLRRDGQ